MRILKRALPLWGAFFVVFSLPVYSQCGSDLALEPVTVAYVYDGDTVRLSDGRHVRLIGLNAPEVAKNGAGEPFSDAAAARLEALLQRGDVFLALGEEPQDHYQRWLGYLYVNQQLVAEQLIREGLAFHIALPPNVQFLDCLKQAERDAAKAGRGLWRTSPWRDVTQLSQRDVGFKLVKGRVSLVKAIRAGWILELDGLLALKISRSIGDDLWVGGDINALEGKLVYVRGWVRPKRSSAPSHYLPWSMTLSHKSHILFSALGLVE